MNSSSQTKNNDNSSSQNDVFQLQNLRQLLKNPSNVERLIPKFHKGSYVNKINELQNLKTHSNLGINKRIKKQKLQQTKLAYIEMLENQMINLQNNQKILLEHCKEQQLTITRLQSLQSVITTNSINDLRENSLINSILEDLQPHQDSYDANQFTNFSTTYIKPSHRQLDLNTQFFEADYSTHREMCFNIPNLTEHHQCLLDDQCTNFYQQIVMNKVNRE